MAMRHLLIYLLKTNKHSADEKGIFIFLIEVTRRMILINEEFQGF